MANVQTAQPYYTLPEKYSMNMECNSGGVLKIRLLSSQKDTAITAMSSAKDTHTHTHLLPHEQVKFHSFSMSVALLMYLFTYSMT